jgi:hypothetical protein
VYETNTCIQMVVENFCNNNEFTRKSVSVSVSVSNVSREIERIERIERECLLINFTTREL